MSNWRSLLTLVTPILAFAGVAGCTASDPAAGSASTGGGKQLIQAGGSGGTRSTPFEVKGRRARIDYRIRSLPSSGTALFTVESYRSASQYAQIAQVQKNVTSSTLSGSFEVPLVPGTYQLRVDTPSSWTATIYELE